MFSFEENRTDYHLFSLPRLGGNLLLWVYVVCEGSSECLDIPFSSKNGR